jgi:adenylate kinase
VYILLLGAPGSGKGTQGQLLAERLGLPKITTGDLLRAAVKQGTRLGREAKGYMDKGALVPDDVILRMIGERLRQADARAGFLLDGFPRTIAQAEGLERLLKDLGRPLERVVYFDVSEPELLRRLTGRRVCRACQSAYHLVSAPPRTAGVCDRCGGELYQREDDSEATVRNRLNVYARQTAPLLDWYRGKNVLASVRGEGPIEAIRAAVAAAASGAHA